MSATELSPMAATAEPLARLELEHVASARYQYGTGRNPYRTGYGSKIRTEYMVTCRGPLEAANGERYRLRRVYVACYGNTGSPYVLIGRTAHYLTPDVERLMVAAKKNRDGYGRAFMRGLDIERAASSSLRSSEPMEAILNHGA